MGALFSFLGGSIFRMIWGELSAAWTKHQDHNNEIEAMRLQDTLDANKAQRELDRMQKLSELGIKELMVKSSAEIESKDADAFIEAMKTVNAPTGITWVDAWNGIIRPLAATTAIVLWWFCLYQQGYKLTEWDKELIGVILGFYFAHRVFTNRSK
jgi:hypothetical protein